MSDYYLISAIELDTPKAAIQWGQRLDDFCRASLVLDRKCYYLGNWQAARRGQAPFPVDEYVDNGAMMFEQGAPKGARKDELQFDLKAVGMILLVIAVVIFGWSVWHAMTFKPVLGLSSTEFYR